MAVEKGNKKLFNLLLSHPKIDVNIEKMSSRPGKYYVKMITEKKTALEIAIQNNKPKIIKLISKRIKYKADVVEKNEKKKHLIMIKSFFYKKSLQ